MNIIFIHQNFPGQYKHLVNVLASNKANRVIAIGDKTNVRASDERLLYGLYASPKTEPEGGHPWTKHLTSNLQRGQAVLRILRGLKERGIQPDIILGHLGWGECMFVKDEFPNVPLVGFSEFFYNAHGADCNFDPEFPSSPNLGEYLRLKNSTQLVSFPHLDLAVSPTRWQADQYPDFIRDRIQVIHEGIDTDAIKPAAGPIQVTLPNGQQLNRDSEVVTFVNRNMEPYRGFHTFMRSIAQFQSLRPNAHIFIVGGDAISYGAPPKNAKTWREAMLGEVGNQIDLGRVHFVGKLAYTEYLKLLQLSTVHVYLTYPFVLSWSMLEAMASGCMVIGSDTAPVREVIQDGINGWLCDFFDHHALAKKMHEAIEQRHLLQAVRDAARQTIVDDYDLKRHCLPQYLQLIDRILKRDCNS